MKPKQNTRRPDNKFQDLGNLLKEKSMAKGGAPTIGTTDPLARKAANNSVKNKTIHSNSVP